MCIRDSPHCVHSSAPQQSRRNTMGTPQSPVNTSLLQHSYHPHSSAELTVDSIGGRGPDYSENSFKLRSMTLGPRHSHARVTPSVPSSGETMRGKYPAVTGEWGAGAAQRLCGQTSWHLSQPQTRPFCLKRDCSPGDNSPFFCETADRHFVRSTPPPPSAFPGHCRIHAPHSQQAVKTG